MAKKHDVDTLQAHRERARREALDRIEAIERKLDAVIMGQGWPRPLPLLKSRLIPRDVEDLGEILAAGSGCIVGPHSRPFQARGPWRVAASVHPVEESMSRATPKAPKRTRSKSAPVLPPGDLSTPFVLPLLTE